METLLIKPYPQKWGSQAPFGSSSWYLNVSVSNKNLCNVIVPIKIVSSFLCLQMFVKISSVVILILQRITAKNIPLYISLSFIYMYNQEVDFLNHRSDSQSITSLHERGIINQNSCQSGSYREYTASILVLEMWCTYIIGY